MTSLRCQSPQTNHGSVPRCPYGPHVRNEDAEDVHAVHQDLILQSSPSRQTALIVQMVSPWVQEH